MPLYDKPKKCKGNANSDKANAEGLIFGSVTIDNTDWGIVLWDADEDPDLYKLRLLLIEYRVWKPVSHE